MKQFNWSRNWKKVEPHLNDPDVRFALHLGLKILNPYYEPGQPPWEEGRGPLNGQRAIKNKLSWYQPWGRCHWIAPFAWAIGQKIYPNLKWGFLTGDLHTVAVGLENDEIEIVMDILLFKGRTAEDSIAQVKERPVYKLCFSIQELFQ